MSVSSQFAYESESSVEQQLFGSVEQILATDGPYLIENEGKEISKWIARYGKVTLTDVNLTHPITEEGFKVLSANIEVGYPSLESAISVHREDPSVSEHDYDNDFIAHDVLAGLKRYITRHPHDKCMRIYRLIRSRDYGKAVDLDEIAIPDIQLLK